MISYNELNQSDDCLLETPNIIPNPDIEGQENELKNVQSDSLIKSRAQNQQINIGDTILKPLNESMND